MQKLILTMLLVPIQIYSWETDNFTSRLKIQQASSKEKIDNRYKLNDETNRLLRKTIDEFNMDKGDCVADMKRVDEKETPLLFDWIDDSIGGTHAVIEEYAEEGNVTLYDHERSWVSMSSNMYDKNYGLQGSFNLNDHVVGPDKLGHFFDQGHDLIEKMIRFGMNKTGLKRAHAKSNSMEEGTFGLWASGVKSYGDMGANYSGLKFYYNLLWGDNPQVTCDQETKKYKLNFDFDWHNHVNHTWDEGVNCSFFTEVENPYKMGFDEESMNTDRDKHFNNYLKELDPPLSCPNEVEKCREVVKENCSNYFVSPKCIKITGEDPKCNFTSLDEMLQLDRPYKGQYVYDRKRANDREGSYHEDAVIGQ